MKFVVRNLADGTFYRSPGEWVTSAAAATSVTSAESALKMLAGQDLNHLELLLVTEDGECRGGFYLPALVQHSADAEVQRER